MIFVCKPYFSLIIDNSSLQDGFDTKYLSQVTVDYSGVVTWMPPALLQSSCEGKFFNKLTPLK